MTRLDEGRQCSIVKSLSFFGNQMMKKGHIAHEIRKAIAGIVLLSSRSASSFQVHNFERFLRQLPEEVL